MPRVLILFSLILTAVLAHGNLLRNPAFQDDWATQLFETKNHHWNYSSEYQNRRDYNPDGWWCKGSWSWENADAEPGKRRLVLQGPNAVVVQRVNWVMVNDDRQLAGFPDGGGFPDVVTQRSKNPLAVVRDLTLRVTLRGIGVPEGAGTVEVSWQPWGGMWVADPMGNAAKPITVASRSLPVGSYRTTVEVTLPAEQWLQAAQAAAKDPEAAAAAEKDGLPLPVIAGVTISYTGKTGRVEVQRAELIAAEPDNVNLLPNGDFEQSAAGYPAHWEKAKAYNYFAPRGYYRFNTWHNTGFPNRGPVGADGLVTHGGGQSLKMVVAAGDDKSVASEPIVLNQPEPRLIEVSAWVKTDHLNALNIEAIDEKGRRLDGCIFVHKAPVSVGTDDWRQIRQVFRPREPVQSIRLLLCARGVNGYTLDDTGTQPQANVVGTIWWDDVRVIEPESTDAELTARTLEIGKNGLVVDPKAATTDSPMPASATVRIARNQLYLNNEIIDLTALQSRLKALHDQQGINLLVVKAEGDVPYQRVIEVLDIARLAGIAQIGLATRQPSLDDTPVAIATNLTALDLGEQKLGDNLLTATVRPQLFSKALLRLELTSPSGKKSVFNTPAMKAGGDGLIHFALPYRLAEPCPTAYTQYRAILSLVTITDFTVTAPPAVARPAKGTKTKPAPARPTATPQHVEKVLDATELWFGAWTAPIDLEIGAAYLRPEQSQFVRMNLGLSARSMPYIAAVQLELLRRGSGQVLKTWMLPATQQALAAQREKIPVELREDFGNLLLFDADVSALPVQPFNDPQRNWVLRSTLLKADGKPLDWAPPVLSTPFCRLAHEPAQPPVASVKIEKNLLYVNNQPWMPWGAVYGHIPVYDGPADSGNYRDLRNLAGWSYYDGFTAAPYNRFRNDLNCLRYVAAYTDVTDPKLVEDLKYRWTKDNLYCSTFFIVPNPVWSLDELRKKAGGPEKLAEYMQFAKADPMVVSTSAGVEEAFGIFHNATPEQLAGMGEAVKTLREGTGKPVMVAHGGGWNRFEFEKVPYYDIFDPETEPWYPAPLHVDLWPLVAGQDKTIWLRPQMYESVPYERWRYHVFVEMMRGCRGWQIAHGPGDQSTFRGLHAEMEFMKPIIYSQDPGPAIDISPWIEHWSRRYNGKTYLAAAVTHPLVHGRWNWEDVKNAPFTRSRASTGMLFEKEEALSYHGIQYLPRTVTVAPGAKLVQWVKLTPGAVPKGLALLLKTDGRWNAAASWGAFDMGAIRNDKSRAYAFLTSFYKNSSGFLGWDDTLVEKALPYIPERAVDQGPIPASEQWIKLEVPLEKIAREGTVIDGVSCLHSGVVPVSWGRTYIAFADGSEQTLIGDSLTLLPAWLAKTKITVPGLKAGAKVRVVFEDREIVAKDGYFLDDFRGQDLYQRFGGPNGYGIGPVALHVYEIQ
ncbi:MAG: ExbD/TolR family protein [Armatimonadota bacterium]